MGEPVWVRRVVSVSMHGGDAEVEDGDRAVLLDHHVARLEVAVDDRHRVHRAQHGAQLGGDRDRPLPRVRVVLGEVVGEVGAVDVLHDEVQLLALAARVVDGDQAGVVDLRGDPALAHEAAAQLVGLLAGHLVGAQQLHRDAPVQPLVVRRPDLAHAALADERGQFVAAGDDPSRRHAFRRRGRRRPVLLAQVVAEFVELGADLVDARARRRALRGGGAARGAGAGTGVWVSWSCTGGAGRRRVAAALRIAVRGSLGRGVAGAAAVRLVPARGAENPRRRLR